MIAATVLTHVNGARNLREPAEDGVILTNPHLQPIGMDQGAQEILDDLGCESRRPARCVLPKALSDACDSLGSLGKKDLRVHISGKRHGYWCRIHRIAATAPFPGEDLVTIHLKREFSTRGAILKLSQQANLTRREEEVLFSIADGLSSKEVAQRLKISPNTVKTYLRLIMVKMGVTTRAAVVSKLLNCELKESE